MGETNNKFQDYLKNPNERCFFLKETIPDEVHDLLKSLILKIVIYMEYPQTLSKFLLKKLKTN